MNTIGVLLLAAATAGDSFGYEKPNVGFKRFLRGHVVTHGAPPAGGMINMAGMGGADGGAGAGNRRFANVKSQIFFLDPDGMQITWQTSGGNGERVYLPPQISVPGRYNFLQGYIYRLKLTNIPGRAGVTLYPTIEVAPSTPATNAYLTHNPIPVQFTAEDFDQVVDGGNFVTKVIYLPDPKYQELAVAGVETLVSTRLEPGVDPILEADKRGTILMIVRLGAIDLEMQGNMGVVVPGPAAPVYPMAPGATVLPPGSLPPGVVSGAPARLDAVPLDASAPVTPAPANAAPAAPAPAPGGDAAPAAESNTPPATEAPATEPAAPAAPAPNPGNVANPPLPSPTSPAGSPTAAR